MPTPSTPSSVDVTEADGPRLAHADGQPAPLRIAAFSDAGGWPGAGIGITRLLTGLDRLGHAVRLYCDDRHVRARAADLDILARRQHLGSDLAVHHALRFGIELRRRAPDVLVLTGRRTLGSGAIAAWRADVDRVVAWIGLESELPRGARDRLVIGGIDAVVVPTRAMRRRVLDALPDFTGEVVSIPPGVPAPVRRGGFPQRATLGVPLGAPLIGMAGPLVERKRCDRFVQVLAELPEAHGLIVGDGPARRRIERLAGRFGVADRLHLAGYRADIGPALDAMDVFLVTSDVEGMSRAMLEAMAAGVPVVSTPVSGAAEALGPAGEAARGSGGVGRAQWDAERGDPPVGVRPGLVAGFEVEALAAGLRTLLADRSRLRAMGQAGRRVAAERFDEATMLAAWDAVVAGRTGT